MKKFLILILLHIQVSYAQEIKELPILSTHAEIIHHTHYSLAYSEEHEQALWVGYRLDKTELLGSHKRKDDFRTDPTVSTRTATNADYAKTGYDRGHLMPAEDATFSETAMSETFYFSNMSPQVPVFNRGQWSQLEQAVRVWAYHFDSLYVFTAGVLTEFSDTIGIKTRIPVPTHYYKALYAFTPSDTFAIAFILPNQKVESFKNHVVSLDSLEKRTHINFFPSIPEKFESTTNTDFWFTILDQTKLPSKQAVEKEIIEEDVINLQTLENEENKSQGVPCIALTKKGTPCKNKTSHPSKKCHVHQD
jgi:endonuclease G, mitochondrial